LAENETPQGPTADVKPIPKSTQSLVFTIGGICSFCGCPERSLAESKAGPCGVITFGV
jgi:hypothetical protein